MVRNSRPLGRRYSCIKHARICHPLRQPPPDHTHAITHLLRRRQHHHGCCPAATIPVARFLLADQLRDTCTHVFKNVLSPRYRPCSRAALLQASANVTTHAGLLLSAETPTADHSHQIAGCWPRIRVLRVSCPHLASPHLAQHAADSRNPRSRQKKSAHVFGRLLRHVPLAGSLSTTPSTVKSCPCGVAFVASVPACWERRITSRLPTSRADAIYRGTACGFWDWRGISCLLPVTFSRSSNARGWRDVLTDRPSLSFPSCRPISNLKRSCRGAQSTRCQGR